MDNKPTVATNDMANFQEKDVKMIVLSLNLSY